jgi:3,4-dihydroxy-9,10-secoandrosta-1,3,5(10)-triene-9,17-dione 4,5-dioxygenase
MPIHSLGYVRWRTPKRDEWAKFATKILGFMPTGGPNQSTSYFRIDDHPYRFALADGESPGIDAIGFEVRDERELADVCRDLEKWGGEVTPGDPDEADEKLVSGLAHWTDPGGVPVEFFYGPILNHEPVVTPLVSHFVTGDMGMGHVVIGTPAAVHSLSAYRDVLDMHCRNTMRLRLVPDAPPIQLWFLGCNPRHHTLGIIGAESPGTLAHFMVEAGSIDDVGRAYDRCLEAGLPIAMTLGKHTNDHMISFYCVAPDGLQVEFGCGGVHVHDPHPSTYEITKVSFWGHRGPRPPDPTP